MISEPVQIALIAGSFPTVGIIVSSYFSYKSNKKSDAKLDTIHTNVNSNWVKAQKEIKELRKIIKQMTKEKTIADTLKK